MENDEITTKQETHYIKTLSKIFNIVPIKDRFVSENDTMSVTMCPANIVLVEAKSKDANVIVNMFRNKENTPVKSIDTEFEGAYGGCNYASEYLTKIFDVFKIDERTKIKSAYEKPLVIENKHFKIILAPRVEN